MNTLTWYLAYALDRLGSYGGEDSPNDITRGMFAGEVGSPRLLKLFAKYGMKTTWFIPGKSGWAARSLLKLMDPSGHSLDTFPKQMAAVRDAGHEMYAVGCSPAVRELT